MSIGTSGRIVIEIEPLLKRELYSALARDGSTLKEWFIRNAEKYLSNSGSQLPPSLGGTPADMGEDQKFGDANSRGALAITDKS